MLNTRGCAELRRELSDTLRKAEQGSCDEAVMRALMQPSPVGRIGEHAGLALSSGTLASPLLTPAPARPPSRAEPFYGTSRRLDHGMTGPADEPRANSGEFRTDDFGADKRELKGWQIYADEVAAAGRRSTKLTNPGRRARADEPRADEPRLRIPG